jgi:2-haloacid dehalogenase
MLRGLFRGLLLNAVARAFVPEGNTCEKEFSDRAALSLRKRDKIGNLKKLYVHAVPVDDYSVIYSATRKCGAGSIDSNIIMSMKKHYPWLWFDADGTLFDYNRAEAAALRNTFHSLTLPFEDAYLDVYRGINHGLWQALERQEITQAFLRYRRFELLMEAIHVNGSPEQMSSAYVEQLSICSELIDGAYEVLQALHRKSQIAVVTNGLQSVQRGRLAHSTIRGFISELIISEEIGAAKPGRVFFDAAFARCGHPLKSDVLIIGDSLTSDIQGGVDYGIDTCWYNPAGETQPEGLEITYEIQHLRELLERIDLE